MSYAIVGFGRNIKMTIASRRPRAANGSFFRQVATRTRPPLAWRRLNPASRSGGLRRFGIHHPRLLAGPSLETPGASPRRKTLLRLPA